MSNSIDILSIKIKSAAEKYKKLKEENLMLKAENNFLRKENERSKKSLGEYAALKENAENAAVKIERILKKIDTAGV